MSGHAILTADAKLPLPTGAKAIGTDKGRVWVKLGWSELAALDAQQGKGWSLAYLDESDFNRGTLGLTSGQIREVMEKRESEQFQLLSDFGDAMGESAGRLSAWGRDGGPAWERNSVKTYGLHQETFFTGRFVYGTHEDLVQLIQWRACLAGWESELAALPSCPPAWAPVAAGLAAAPTLKPLAEAAAHLGQPAYTLAPALDHSLRIAYTTPSPQISARLSRNELTAEPWGKKFLIPLKAREIQALRPRGAKPVYLAASVYQRSARLLSADQRRAEIDQRITGGISHVEYWDNIVRLRLTFLAFLRGHQEEEAASSKADSVNLARLESVFRDELAALDSVLRLAWGAPAGAAYRSRAEDLRSQAKALSNCADRAGEIGLVDLLSLFEKILPTLEPV